MRTGGKYINRLGVILHIVWLQVWLQAQKFLEGKIPHLDGRKTNSRVQVHYIFFLFDENFFSKHLGFSSTRYAKKKNQSNPKVLSRCSCQLIWQIALIFCCFALLMECRKNHFTESANSRFGVSVFVFGLNVQGKRYFDF